jgi:WD40 repeat protein
MNKLLTITSALLLSTAFFCSSVDEPKSLKEQVVAFIAKRLITENIPQEVQSLSRLPDELKDEIKTVFFPNYRLLLISLFSPISLIHLHYIGGKAPLVFSPDGRYLFTGSVSEIGLLWDVSDSNNIKCFFMRGHRCSITSAAFSSDSKRILTGSYDKTARLWDISDVATITSIPLETHGMVSAVALSSNDQYALTGCYDSTARLWDITNLNNIKSYPLRAHYTAIESMAFSHSNKEVFTASAVSNVFRWNITDVTNITSRILANRGVVALSPDGKYALTGLELWDLSNNMRIDIPINEPYKVVSTAISLDNKYALSSCGPSVYLCDLSTISNLHPICLETAHSTITSVAFSSDSNYALTGSYKPRLWDISNSTKSTSIPLESHKHGTVQVAFGPKNRYFATGSQDAVRLYRMQPNVTLEQVILIGKLDTLKKNAQLVAAQDILSHPVYKEIFDTFTGQQKAILKAYFALKD